MVALITLPFLAVPFFLIFGRSKFEGYNQQRRLMDRKVIKEFSVLGDLKSHISPLTEGMDILNRAIIGSNQPGFTRDNSIELLVNADETYASMLNELRQASEYIVFQFYIFRADEIGLVFAEILMEKARMGVSVHFLHDDIGHDTHQWLIEEMIKSGIKIAPFNSQNLKGRLQLNFRNHRKILIIDGRVAYVGGLNIGDDYLGRWNSIGPWRDTHVKLRGPSVLAAQLATAKDWYCSKGESLDVPWKINPSHGTAQVMILHTGPADDKHACLLAHMAMINSSHERLWISNPYFVPPESLMDAILLASLRGVDVRIMIPEFTDSRLVDLASRVYQERLLDHGVKVYRYHQGFMHQKVMLVDDKFGSVGSVNFDCRSMFINFEITAISTEKGFIIEMERMLVDDFASSLIVTEEEFKKTGVMEKISSRGANLLAPVL